MPSKDEHLCMAVIKNSTITNINWEGVAKDLGVDTANAANCQWRRLKKKFADEGPPKPNKTKASKKPAIEELSDREEGKIVRKKPARTKKNVSKKAKMETPESDNEKNDWVDDEV